MRGRFISSFQIFGISIVALSRFISSFLHSRNKSKSRTLVSLSTSLLIESVFSMSWKSPNLYYRSAGEIVDVKHAYERKKRKSEQSPTRNPKGSDHQLPPTKNPDNFEGMLNPSFDFDVSSTQIPEGGDDGQKNPSPDPDFERRTK